MAARKTARGLKDASAALRVLWTEARQEMGEGLLQLQKASALQHEQMQSSLSALQLQADAQCATLQSELRTAREEAAEVPYMSHTASQLFVRTVVRSPPPVALSSCSLSRRLHRPSSAAGVWRRWRCAS